MSTLQSYIHQGEHQTQDFKFRVDDAKKIARTISAFANTDGGRLLIGVKDNGKVVGIDPEEEFHIVQGAAELFCNPPVPIETMIWQDDHKLVLEVIVTASPLKPHKSKDDDGAWKTYVRRNDHTLIANKILLGVWNLRKKGAKKPQQFSEDEMKFLGLFKSNEKFTLSRLYRLSDLKKSKVDHLLKLFITWEILNMEITPEGTFYSARSTISN
ncbi:MAG: ATP-binding protein [Crocinitomicaceae bacterium]|nr:ATP-binding protein [Crocinitomicaceae bacterium]